MKRFLLNSILFLAIFFVIEKSSYYLLLKAPEKEIDKRLEYVLNGNINKDLIILGSSRGVGNIMAGQLEEQTGLSSYNLSYQGTNIEFHNFIFTTLLKNNKAPKKLILSIDSPYTFLEEKSLGFRAEPLIPLSANNYINNELIKRGENSLLSKFFYLGRISKSNFSFKKIKQRPNNPIDNYGSMPLLKTTFKNKNLQFNYNLIAYNLAEETPRKLEVFKHIQQVCKDKNIELICVFTPSFVKFHQPFLERFKLLLTPENKLFTYNLERDIYTDTNYFYDVSHLNLKGATLFTSELSTFINKN